MVSLNSLGTGSPIATPAPTPTPPTVVSAPLPVQLNLSSKPDGKLNEDHVEAKEAKLLNSEKFIHELKPISQSQEILSRSDNTVVYSSANESGKSDFSMRQPSSPTKSFLTQFPVVKEKSSSANSTPTKSYSRSTEKSPEVVNPHHQHQHSKEQKSRETFSSAKQQQDFSVYDFSESRSSENLLYDMSAKNSQTPISKSSSSSNRWTGAKSVSTPQQQLPVSSSAPVKQMPVAPVVSYSDKMPRLVSSYSDKPVLSNLSYSQPVSQAMKLVASHSYPSYNISSSGNASGLTSSSGHVAGLSSSYQKSGGSSSMTRFTSSLSQCFCCFI
jgi:hypothetical protein